MSFNVEVLEDSFAQIQPHASEFAADFYSNLFNDYPQVQPLFANTNMVEQRKHLVSALVLVIANLRNYSNPKSFVNNKIPDFLKKSGI